ncbi:MAG: sialate O-acetylesterase [Oscillospiraceae bacterium]|jgi:sialate O-acetylesterase|nr:sialate O-acetylesterase [Oscillospiraceae bacterium]
MCKKTICCAAVFSDHMVLQRGKPVSVFGEGRTGTKITVSIAGCQAQTEVRGGRWQAELPAQDAGGPYVLSVTDGETELAFQDVLFGEVWLAGGQSNMELELQNCGNGQEELTVCENPEIRFYNVQKRAFVDDAFLDAERQTCWKICAPQNCADVSAVAYFCAKKMQHELKVPVGILDCYWGGTTISCWMSERQLARSIAGQKYLDDYAALIGDKTDEQYAQEMADYNVAFQAWDARVKARRAKEPKVTWEVLNAECGACPWPQPAGRKSPFRPAGLYCTMIQRVVPYTIRGFLYYQGEEDAPRCHDYGEMMVYLIDQWRRDWHDLSLPFLFVQLPVFISKEEWDSGTDSRAWCFLREQQEAVCRTVRGTGMAAALDCGEFDNVHPLDKQTVGTRLALQVLQKVYGEPIESDSPTLSGCVREDGRLRLTFVHSAGGLLLRGECTNRFGSAFEVAGEDGQYFPASPEVEGSSVLLTSAKVPEPKYARYAWYSYGPTPLYGGSGLPALPFRMQPEN